MHKAKFNIMDLELTVTPRSPLLINAGGVSPNPALPDMRFIRTFTKEKGETLYIPGSSLKGVFRSYAENILRTKKSETVDGACDPFGESACAKRISMKEKTENRTLKSFEVYKASCKACKVFGNTSLKGRLSVVDAYPEHEIQTEIRHGVAISRLTHAVAAGPFDMEVAVSGTFETKVHLENFEAWQIGLLALAVQGINEGLLRIGFGKNRGFGEAQITVKTAKFLFSKNSSANEIWGVGMLNPEERTRYGFAESDKFQVDAEPQESHEILYVRRVYRKDDWNTLALSAISHLQETLK